MVLTAVFVPSALQPGATGIIYCAVRADHRHIDGLFRLPRHVFHPGAVRGDAQARASRRQQRRVPLVRSRPSSSTAHGYEGHVGRAVQHAPRWMVVFALVTVLAGFLYTRLPTSFVPDEDQGFVLALVNMPSGATLQRTDQVMREVRDTLLKSPVGKDIDGIFQPEGFSFVGPSENVGMTFIKLKDWSERSANGDAAHSADQRDSGAPIPDAQIFAVNLPTIRGLSRFGGVDLYLLARAGQSRRNSTAARNDPARRGGQKPQALSGPPQLAARRAAAGHRARPRAGAIDGIFAERCLQHDSMEFAPILHQSDDLWRADQARLHPGRRAATGSRPTRCAIFTRRVQRRARWRRRAGRSIRRRASRRSIPSAANTSISPYNMLPLSSVIKAKWGVGPTVLQRYNGYPAIEIVGNPAAGYTTGEAMDAVQDIVDQVPARRLCRRLDRPVLSGGAGGQFGDRADGLVHPHRVPVPGGAL